MKVTPPRLMSKINEDICTSIEQFSSRHVLENGEINPLVKNHIVSMKGLQKLKEACSGTGVKGRFWLCVGRLIPFGMKVYGKCNRVEFLAIPPIFQFVEPTL
jgi:hypothetical protein